MEVTFKEAVHTKELWIAWPLAEQPVDYFDRGPGNLPRSHNLFRHLSQDRTKRLRFSQQRFSFRLGHLRHYFPCLIRVEELCLDKPVNQIWPFHQKIRTPSFHDQFCVDEIKTRMIPHKQKWPCYMHPIPLHRAFLPYRVRKHQNYY